ncbi:hypothetical protein BV22DRAFT_1196038 [Leucogyrophana mollusca]|uniref:Uncharacterized protein n=1 Tax=Leucogyrophana mollusca TaxID=85980 RepID=A0ACB8BEZ5_9AGAM|nr:hypothetical protein BV22DRAFT_1196038 [Leucogyrophana mollusca]
MSSEAWDEDDGSVYGCSSPSSKSVRSAYTHTFTSPAPDGDSDKEDDPLIIAARPRLPTEITDYIFSLFFHANGSFYEIGPFSLASSQFRQIALRSFFSSLQIASTSSIKAWINMHASMISNRRTFEDVGLHCVKSLSSTSYVAYEILRRQPAEVFKNLRHLSLSFGEDGRSTQKNRVNAIFPATAGINTWFPCQLTSLALTALWRIDVPLLQTISGAMPSLATLHLSCSEHLDVSCCWLCFEESSSVVIHSPIPNHFANVSCLTEEFGKALKLLTCLTDLHLGIFLSDENMLEDMLDGHLEEYGDGPYSFEVTLRHAFSRLKSRSPPGGTVLSQLEDGLSRDISFSTSDGDERESKTCEYCGGGFDAEICPVCDLLVLAPAVRTRELEASLGLARKLKTLRTVGWSSFFSSGLRKEKEGDLARMAKVFILRANGRVRVRRRPWN